MITPKNYFEEKEKKVINKDLFYVEAENIIKEIAEDEKPSMTSTQIRKFYDEILRRKMIIELRDNKEIEFKRQLPYIRMIVTKAKYGFSRKPKTVNKKFVDFLEKNIIPIKDYETFKVFCDLFEAVVAYSKKHLS